MKFIQGSQAGAWETEVKDAVTHIFYLTLKL